MEFMDAYAQDEAGFEKDFRIYFPTIIDDAIQYISKTLYPPVLDGSYAYTTQIGRVDLMISEAFFTCSTNFLSRAYKNKIYGYIFSDPPSLHDNDIEYTYYNGPAPGVVNNTLAVVMQDYFTMTGNPNRPGLPNFSQLGSEGNVLNFSQTFINTIEDNTQNERCLWWQKGLYY